MTYRNGCNWLGNEHKMDSFSLLLELPRDTWYIISKHLNVDDLNKLWTAGNKQINYGLHSTVTRLRQSSKRLPKIVTARYPNVRELEITYYNQKFLEIVKWYDLRRLEIANGMYDLDGLMTKEIIEACPQNLQFLRLMSVHFENFEVLRRLPQSLQHLEMSYKIPGNVDDNKIRNYLPSGLKHLVLSTNTSTLSLYGINDNIFANLPPKLTKLSIYRVTKITGKTFDKLPSTLKKINLNDSPVNGEYLGLLPRDITEIIFNSANIKDEHLKMLPPNLRSLSLSSNNIITDYGLADLPRNLQSLNLSANRNIKSWFRICYKLQSC